MDDQTAAIFTKCIRRRSKGIRKEKSEARLSPIDHYQLRSKCDFVEIIDLEAQPYGECCIRTMIQHMHTTGAQPQISANNVAIPRFPPSDGTMDCSMAQQKVKYCSGTTLKGGNSIEHQQIVQQFIPSRLPTLAILA